MTVRVFDEDVYISEEDIKTIANEVINTIKEKLPKEHHKPCVVSAVLSEAENLLSCKTLNL